MNANQTAIQKRQHFYWLGRKMEDENDIPKGKFKLFSESIKKK